MEQIIAWNPDVIFIWLIHAVPSSPGFAGKAIILDIRLPRVVLINNGRVVVQGQPHEVITEGNLSSLHGIDVVVVTVNGLRVIMPRVCVS